MHIEIHKINLEANVEYKIESYPHSGLFRDKNENIYFVIKSVSLVLYIGIWDQIKDLIKELPKEEPVDIKPVSNTVDQDFVLKFAAILNKQKITT